MGTAGLDVLPGDRVLVVGAGIAGRAAADALVDLGAAVTVADDRPAVLENLAAQGRVATAVGAELAHAWPADIDLVVVSPGVRPDAPIPTVARAAGVPVWGDVELAWRLDAAGIYGPARTWVVITGTNGKTTTTSMVEAIVAAAGIDTVACGNIGLTVIEALRRGATSGAASDGASGAAADGEPPARVLAVELSSFQLYWAPSVRPAVGVVLNIAEDHLDWHGGMDGYVAAKLRALGGAVGIVGLDDPGSAALLERSAADRTIGFTAGEPGPDRVGIVDGELLDRAFPDPESRTVLAPVAGIEPPGPAGRLDAAAASAAARAIGIAPEAVASGLRSFHVGPHRGAVVGDIGGVRFVDDSKATNPHAALASMRSYESIVWVAGGLLKGAHVDDLIAEVRPRLVAAVLLGRDAPLIADALRRHAPDVPVRWAAERHDTDVTSGADVQNASNVVDVNDVMRSAVAAARSVARPGDTVLLAPAAASLDMFVDYKQRGDSFAAAVAAAAGGADSAPVGVTRGAER